jgi:hypothetical protein
MFESIALYAVLARKYGLKLSGLTYDWLDSTITVLEQKYGPRIWAALLSGLLMLAAAIYCRPALTTSSLGSKYALLAQDLFGTDPNPVAYRVLTPLLSYCLGLRGELIIVTNLIIAAIFIYLIYRYFRMTSPRPGDALIAAAIISFSLVTLSTLYYGGYCDSLTYLVIFLMWRTRKNPYYFYGLLLLGLLNRESIAFLIPWFLFLTFQESNSKFRWVIESIAGIALSLGLYQLFREWMAADRTVTYNMSFYITPLLQNPLTWIKRSVMNWPIGLFTVFKLLWVVVPIAAVSLWQSGRKREVWSLVILLVCAFSQLVLAYDTSRLLTMAYMLVILSLTQIFQNNSSRFRQWVGWLLLANLFVPQLYTTAEHIYVMHPFLFDFVASHFAKSLL